MRLGCFSGFHLTRHWVWKWDPCNGGKNSKERILALLACSANGTDRLLPLVLRRVKTFVAHKFVASHLYWRFKGIRCQKESPKQKDITFHWPVCCSSPKHKLLKECVCCFFPPNCILQPLDQGKITSFAPYYYRQLAGKLFVWLITICFMM
jgi:hypothetical protein